MTKKIRPQANPDPVKKGDLSSLTDVCFLLLIYFLVTSTVHLTEKELSLKLPEGGKTLATLDALYLNVNSSGMVSVGKGDSRETLDTHAEDHSLPLLSSRVELYKTSAELSGNPPLIELSVSDNTAQQRLMDVMNCLARLGISSITFNEAVTEDF